ncbi:hypothetical protein EV360DRAFT_69381, partial [Lentinula raphanica]
APILSVGKKCPIQNIADFYQAFSKLNVWLPGYYLMFNANGLQWKPHNQTSYRNYPHPDIQKSKHFDKARRLRLSPPLCVESKSPPAPLVLHFPPIHLSSSLNAHDHLSSCTEIVGIQDTWKLAVEASGKEIAHKHGPQENSDSQHNSIHADKGPGRLYPQGIVTAASRRHPLYRKNSVYVLVIARELNLDRYIYPDPTHRYPKIGHKASMADHTRRSYQMAGIERKHDWTQQGSHDVIFDATNEPSLLKMFSVFSFSYRPRSGFKAHGLVILLVLGLVSLAGAGPVQAHDRRGEVHASEDRKTFPLEPAPSQGVGQSANAPAADHTVHYTLGQTTPYWAVEMNKKPVGLFNIVFKSWPDGIPSPDKTWFIIAMMESEGIAIVRDKPNVMKEAMADKNGHIEFSLRNGGNFGVIQGDYHIASDQLKLYLRRKAYFEDPVILKLLWLEAEPGIRIMPERFLGVLRRLPGCLVAKKFWIVRNQVYVREHGEHVLDATMADHTPLKGFFLNLISAAITRRTHIAKQCKALPRELG